VAAPPIPDSPRRLWPWAVALAVAGLAAYLFISAAAPGEAKATSTASSGGGSGKASSGKSSGGSRAVPVVASPARVGDMRVDLTGLGTVSALNTVTVRSRVDGQLVNVHFTEGQFVNAGDLLAEIDPRPFQVQLAQAEGQLAKDKATLANAKLDLDRYQELFKNNLVPKQQVDTQATTLSQIDGAIKADQAQIENARLNLTYARITAPISGRVGLRLLDAGNIVHANDQTGLLVITQVDPIAVVFTIPEDSLQPVLRRMKGSKLPVDAYNRDLKTKLATGTLLTVDNQIDQTTGTVKLKAIFPNKDNTLFPNQFVNVRLLVDTLHDAVIVPSAAIQHSPQGTFVYVVQKDAKADAKDGKDASKDATVAMRDVQVRLAEGDDTAIAAGVVAAGEQVVTDGIDKLQPGAKVTLQRAGGDKNEKSDKAGKGDKTDKAEKSGAKATEQ
jgi:membrane fusion protein, multidrug efflux system